MKMSRLQHKYCIGLLLDISTTANNTAATQKCKDVLNDTTAYNPNLHSKFEMSINKFIFCGLLQNQIIIISPDWVIDYFTKTMLKINIPPKLPLSYYSIFQNNKIYR